MGDPSVPQREEDLERIELRLLFEAIFDRYGLDFREYAQASIKRRVRRWMESEGLSTISSLQDRVLRDPDVMEHLLSELSVGATSMFRDPAFFLAFRTKIIPWLKTYPLVRIWHVGCSTGEEAYSMAILLQEEGMLRRARVYATDLNAVALKKASDGIFPLDKMQEYTQNYLKAGGKQFFSNYYTARYGSARFSSSLCRHIVFARHNLVTDGSFNEFNVILCRNVMIYFNRSLQNRVHELLYASLARSGVLALGDKESIRFTPHEHSYEELDREHRLYRKSFA